MSSKTKPETKQNSGGPASNRMSSIARSINLEFWAREFSHLLVLDLVLAGLVAAAFFLWWEGQVPAGMTVENRYFLGTDHMETLAYVIETADGTQYPYLLSQFFALCKIPALGLLILEGLIVFGNLFSTKAIRRKMKPLNEIAIRTEQLARGQNMTGQNPAGQNGAGQSGSVRNGAGRIDLKTMEQAVSRLNPEEPGARVVTGDKELQSLEIAINNLLDRMRESHRQQERFVSDASHELRTPIAVIQGYVNMLDRWGKDDEQILKESIEALKNESEHMKNLVEQLLFLARGDSGRNTLHYEDCDLAEMVRDVMEESAMIDEKHVYRFEGPAAARVMVHGDPAMLKQSMRIFVQNAAKYSAEGDTIVLRAGISPVAAGEHAGRPFYSVQDEGIGMQSSEVVHVFERFYRSDAARNSSQGGTGLGLSIAKWIVDAHSGIIEILSRPDFGTRITVRL
ncbi:MAG: sensor histidine kinase [Anaerovoracaceae bacterium]